MRTTSGRSRRGGAGRDDFATAYQSALHEVGVARVLVIGATGAGKSTLINAFFIGRPACTGTGRPVTSETTYYETPNGLLGIYDTKGTETGDSRARIVQWLKDTVRETRIDVAWFCIRAGDARVDDTQLHLIQKLTAAGVPVIVVFTKVSRDVDGHINPATLAFMEAVSCDLLGAGAKALIPTAAESDSWSTPTTHGLDHLLTMTRRLLQGSSAEDAFDAAQAIDWSLKRSKSRDATLFGAATAAAAAAAPVPGADTLGVASIQIAMMARIAAVYGIPAGPRKLAETVGPIIFGRAVPFLAKALAKAALRLVPGANIAAGATAAVIAGASTYALGEAWMWTCELLASRGSLDDVTMADLRAEFRKHYTRRSHGEARGAA